MSFCKITKLAASALLIFCLITILLLTSACTDEDITSDIPEHDSNLCTYSDAEIMIYDKISDLASHKARQTLTDNVNDDIFSFLSSDAVPSEDDLAEIKLDVPVKTDGNEISDMADFVRCFEGVYDVFGMKKDVVYEGETYSVYEIVIQDKNYGGHLSTQLKQGNSIGCDLYSDKKAKTVSFDEHSSPFFGNIASAIDSLFGSATSSGHTQSYRVSPYASSTVSFMFVYGHDGKWHHCATSSYVSVYERHDWVLSVAVDDKSEHKSGSKELYSTEHPDHYDSRALLAAIAYKNGEIYDITQKSVIISVDMSEFGGGEKQTVLDAAHPLTVEELIALSK